MEKTLCEACKDREHCQDPCKAVNEILWANNHVMERYFSDHIEVYPQHRLEVHFSGLKDNQVKSFSNDDVVPWSSGDCELTQTKIFIEKFFNKTPTKELAERFGIKEQAVLGIYWDALKKLEKLIGVLDMRTCGLKALKPDRFTPDQKMFLLVCVFRFNAAEVARMFNRDRNRVNLKIKRLTDKYAAAFSGMAPKEEIPVDDPPISAKLTRADVVNLVDGYTEQGLSLRKAFKRIADRQGEVIGRPVNPIAIGSQYNKTLAAGANSAGGAILPVL